MKVIQVSWLLFNSSEDSCENITAPRKYCHPIENQLLFFELPGIGSENWTECEYVLKNQLWKYDYFFIVFDTVLHEDDLWFAQQLVKMNKPFVLVRSKVDLDIKMDCSEDASSKIIKLRKKTFSTIDKIDVLKANVGVCFISSFNDDIGDMAKLKNHIISNLKAKKFETELYSLNALYKAINDKKYILLKKQILIVTTVVASISATRFSGIEVGVNIAILAMEIYHFINELGLCWKEKTSLINLADSQIKCSELEKTNWKILRYMLQQSPKCQGRREIAEVGCGDTTQSPTPYFHPDNNQIVFWDLPGVGTLEFPKDTYIKEMELHKYDYFFVFFDTVLQEDDLWLAKQLIKMKKPFCLVRSKVDKDVQIGLKNGIDEKTVYVNLRTKTFKSLNTHIHLKAHCKIFFISGQKKGVEEIDKLFQHIKENLSSIKSEAVVYTLHTLSQEMIEEKFKSLKSRVNTASLGTALISASPIPGIDIYANISILVNEIKHYIEVFGLTHKQIRKVSYRDQKQLKCKELFGLNSEKRTRKIVSAMFVNKYLVLFTALSVSDIFLPIVGSLISAATTATIVYKFLNEILENLHQDAVFVYDLILPLPVRIIKALKVRFENEGQVGLNKYIFDMLDRWKDETVMIGVIGEPNSGKN
ncbi:unnamed protein product [Mytilus edulis]|uniref:IRG-type G domain-containing protein n=1 Tax=Mytilus edulis TaxID=6550 RepID=A0A8S3R0P4_MYTED|nr:unnamed protein product [Mytilus edulis]